MPAVVVLGGPNGAGKSTAAPRLLRGSLKVDEFVNADTLAQGLSAFRPADVAVEAGRIMLRRLDDLESAGKNFACESTLAGQALATRLARLKTRGYRVWSRPPQHRNRYEYEIGKPGVWRPRSTCHERR